MSGSSSAPVLTSFTSGDLVISVVGDGDGSGTYTDNQASPIVLEEIDPTTGLEVGQMTLPEQTTTLANGTVEYAVSGEYGSSSEGSLELSGDGQSLVIAGYGVNAVTYNTGGAAVYGNAAEAQSTSVQGGPYTAVPRVIADISYNGTVDTSTALYNVFNENNPRSVATYNGSSFYISGQATGAGDPGQGLLLANDGAKTATSIDETSDTRTVEYYNGQLYLSRDSKQVGGGEINTYSSALPTSTSTPTQLPGLGATVTLSAAQANGVNNSDIGKTVNLSPENFFFANATTLYVADGGVPKEGGLGDGGLQKWTYNTSTSQWTLDYTLADGLNLVPNTATAGTSGLIGLTGTVLANGTVMLYATNETIGDLDQKYLYEIADTLSATTLPVNETFTALVTAAPDTNIRGVAFAPSASTLAPTNITIASGTSVLGITVTSGGTLAVLAGGTAVGATVLSGGTASIYGLDSGSYIAEGGFETVIGTANVDTIYGTQLISASGASIINETVFNGGAVELFLKGETASSTSIESGGRLLISGNATANNTTINGGEIILESPKALLTGMIDFSGTSSIVTTAVISAGYGDLGTIVNFAQGDAIDLASVVSSGATLASSTANGNTIETIVSGTIKQFFTFAGGYLPGEFGLTSDGTNGVDLTLGASGTIASGQNASNQTVATGGTIVIANSGTAFDAVIDGGTVILQGPQSALTGTLAFDGAGTLVIDTVSSAGAGDQAVIYGFGNGDIIDLVSFDASLTSSVVGGNTIETVTSGAMMELFTFSGTYPPNAFSLVPDPSGTGVDLVMVNSQTVTSGETFTGLTVASGQTLTVLTGGTIIDTSFLSGSMGSISGTDIGGTIASGAFETFFAGAAMGDQVYGTQIVNSGAMPVFTNETIFNGGSLELLTKGAVANGSTIFAGGSIVISGNSTVENTMIDGGTLFMESPKSTVLDGLTFGRSGTIDITGLISSGYGNLQTISNFSAGDVILLSGFGAGTSFSNTYANGLTIETVSNANNAASQSNQSFTFSGSLSPGFFLNTTNGNISELTAAPCFSSGTRILTPNGEIQVQDLKIGDHVITRDGEDKPIIWIGRRMLNLRQHPRQETVQPIRIDAGAFDDVTPNRDLILSPDHALYLDGYLVPAKALLNGTNITQLNRATVTYYHLELATHEVIFADGTMVETYLESGNRGSFDNGGAAVTLHPDFAQTLRESKGYAPFSQSGPVVESFKNRADSRSRLLRKFGTR